MAGHWGDTEMVAGEKISIQTGQANRRSYVRERAASFRQSEWVGVIPATAPECRLNRHVNRGGVTRWAGENAMALRDQ